MPKFNVVLARFVRQFAYITVEADSEEIVSKGLSDIYQLYEGPWDEYDDYPAFFEDSDAHCIIDEAILANCDVAPDIKFPAEKDGENDCGESIPEST